MQEAPEQIPTGEMPRSVVLTVDRFVHLYKLQSIKIHWTRRSHKIVYLHTNALEQDTDR